MESKTSVIWLIDTNHNDAELVSSAILASRRVHDLMRFSDTESALERLFDCGGMTEAAKASWPDLIILDLARPCLSVYEFVEQLKSSQQTKAIPIIVLTEFEQDDEIVAVYEAGANSCIVKPTSIDEYIIKLAEMIMYWCQTAEVPSLSQIHIQFRRTEDVSTAGQTTFRRENTPASMADTQVFPKPTLILVVEDDPVDATLAKTSIEKHPLWSVDISSTLKTALEMMGTKAYDVLLIDYNLPDGVGLDIIDWVPNNSAIIVMTGQGSEEIAAEAVRSGAHDYIMKDSLFRGTIVDRIQNAIHQCQLRKTRVPTSATSESQNKTVHS